MILKTEPLNPSVSLSSTGNTQTGHWETCVSVFRSMEKIETYTVYIQNTHFYCVFEVLQPWCPNENDLQCPAEVIKGFFYWHTFSDSGEYHIFSLNDFLCVMTEQWKLSDGGGLITSLSLLSRVAVVAQNLISTSYKIKPHWLIFCAAPLSNSCRWLSMPGSARLLCQR